VAAANAEAVRARDTVLYERWKSNRRVFVGALADVTEEVFELYAPPERGCCIDIGCGFGESTRQLAELVGPGGSHHLRVHRSRDRA
jgi:ubiquinone/menaquinone biosynthesis C-methylase UbiE